MKTVTPPIINLLDMDWLLQKQNLPEKTLFLLHPGRWGIFRGAEEEEKNL